MVIVGWMGSKIDSKNVEPLLQLFLNEVGPRWADASFLVALSLCKALQYTGKRIGNQYPDWY